MGSNLLRNINAFVIAFGLLLVVISYVIGYPLGFYTDLFQFDKIGLLSVFSLIIFLGMCVAAFNSSNIYFLLLVFMIIAFPSPVDNFSPGILLGLNMERGVNVFPLVTHIDIYLLLGIIKFNQGGRWSLIINRFLVISVLIMVVSLFANMFYSESVHELLLLFTGFFQLRYLLLMYLLFSMVDISGYRKYIFYGIIVSVIFLFFESLAFTILGSRRVLSSGSLGTNTFANIMINIALYMFFIKNFFKMSFNRYLTVVISILGIGMMLATGTRIAVITGLFVLLIYYWNSLKFRQFLFKGVVAVLIFVAVFMHFDLEKEIPEKYNWNYLADKIEYTGYMGELTEMFNIERSWETNSFITRLELFQTSVNMIIDRPVFGIGAGRWNIKKMEYGFREKVLIDSHNGYLSMISQYGVFSVIILGFIYLYPFRLLRKFKKQKVDNYLIFLPFINLGMGISDLTNSGIFKHQVFAFLVFTLMVTLNIERSLHKKEQDEIESQ